MNRFYKPWVDDGRPWRNAVYIAEFIGALNRGFPLGDAANIFGSIGDYAHLTADTPQDHTPYSQTGWPVPTPYPVVTASDVMHRPDLGVDCTVLVPYWLAAAKAGRMPWLKYIIWQGKRYDVRNSWQPVAASGHFGHAHLSGRSDKVSTGLGGWNPIPTGGAGGGTGDDDVSDAYDLLVTGLRPGAPSQTHTPEPRYPSIPNSAVLDKIWRASIDARIAADGVIALKSVVEQLADIIRQGGGSADTAAILRGVDERLAEQRSAIEADTRDAVADLAEGGASAVRADQ